MNWDIILSNNTHDKNVEIGHFFLFNYKFEYLWEFGGKNDPHL